MLPRELHERVAVELPLHARVEAGLARPAREVGHLAALHEGIGLDCRGVAVEGCVGVTPLSQPSVQSLKENAARAIHLLERRLTAVSSMPLKLVLYPSRLVRKRRDAPVIENGVTV